MASGHRPADGRVAPYGQLAEVYDIVHGRKPYAAEARDVRRLARRDARRPCRTLLDVACGSGRHLEAFARSFDCTGVDASPAMLRLARRRVPGARFVRAAMESFDLGREFDVVTCLFSAIAYARSVPELRTVVRNLARHTAPGGVVVVEPFITPAEYRPGHVHHVVAHAGETTVVRMNGADRRAGRLRFDFHHLVGRAGTVTHYLERHDVGLFPAATMRAAFRDAGLAPRYVRGGLTTHRGLWVARQPGAPAPTARRRRSPSPP